MSTLYKNEDGSYIMNEGELINKRELAEWLGITIRTVQRMMNKGLPFIRFKNYVAYNKSDVEKWLKDNNYGPVELIAKWNKRNTEEI